MRESTSYWSPPLRANVAMLSASKKLLVVPKSQGTLFQLLYSIVKKKGHAFLGDDQGASAQPQFSSQKISLWTYPILSTFHHIFAIQATIGRKEVSFQLCLTTSLHP
ncbi:hypothetical protein Scep_019107 [Stephania cephalantha]|uniref:Uncharacterized protein n=1 Tax=Stephania cephalantha TaxID=152367 RepID=A0AAP0IAL5_9MAGN